MPEQTVKVTGELTGNFKFDAEAGEYTAVVDQSKGAGGDGAGPNPLQYLFLSLGGCVATIARMTAKRQRVELRGVEVEIEGDIDTDFLTGKTDEGRAGFKEIRVHTRLDTDLSEEDEKAFLEEVDRRCPISDNLTNTTSVEFILE
jgi:uncharacterized OsmC-like protein